MAAQLISTNKGRTKLERSAEIFDSMSGSGRAEVVQVFQQQLEMTPACAGTYYQLNRQRLNMVSHRGH